MKMPTIDEILGGAATPTELSSPQQSIDSILGIPEKPGLIRSLADTALEIPMGANAATKAIIDAFGAGSGPSNWLDSTVKNYQAMQSPYRQFERGVQAQRSQDAEAAGSAWNEVGASFQNFAEAPISAMANAAGSIVPTAIGMAAAAPAGMATGAAAGMGALMGAGAVKGSIYDDLIARGKGAGLSDVEAKTQADAAQAYFGPNMDQIGIGTILGVLAGSTGVEKVLGGAPSTVRNLAARTLLGAGQEAVPEAAQGGQEKLAANLAAQRAGYQADTWSGVAGQATAEGLASTGPGGVAGAMAKYEAAKGPISRAAAIAEAQQAQALGALPAPGQLSGQAAMGMGQGGDVGDPAAVLAAQQQNTELQAARQAEEQRRAQFDPGYVDRLNGTQPAAPVATDGQGAATDAQATDAQPQDRQRTRYAGPEPLIGVDPAQPQQLAMPGPIPDPAVQLDVKRTTTQDQYLAAQRKRANGQLLSQQETVLLNGPNPFADAEGRIITEQQPAVPRPAQGEAAVQEVLQVEDNLAYMRAGPNDEVLDRTPKPGKAPNYFAPIAQKNGRVAVATPSTEGVATLARQLGGVPNKAAGGFTFRDGRVANQFVKAAEAEGFVMTPAAQKAKVASTQQAAETVASANGDRVEDVSIYTAQDLPDTAARGERGSRLSRAQASVIEGMGRIFGTQYRFYDSPNAAQLGDGFIIRGDRTAFVRAVEGDAAPLVVAGHETYHGLSKAERARFSAAINPYVDASDDAQLAFLSDYTTGKYKDKILKLHASGVTSGEILDAIIEQAKQDGTAKLDRAALREEFDADIFGNRLKETALWEKVFAAMAQQDRSLLVKLRDSIKQIIAYLKSQKGQIRGFDTDRYVKDLEAVQQIAARAILSSANRQQKSEQASPSAGNVVRSAARVGPYRSKSTADLTATLKGGTVVQVGDEFFVEQGNGQGLDQGRSDRAKVDAGTGRQVDQRAAPGTDNRAARDNQPAPRQGPAAVDVESGIRRGADGAVSLTGVHFSRAPRQVLDGRFYGTGLKGAEARRLMGEPDRRLHERVYAYVNEGAGVTAESGVGGYPHALDLSNLYDLASDPLLFRRRLGKDTNAIEAAILDAGFSGYYSKGAFPALKQGAAVVLGDASHAVVPKGDVVRSPVRTLEKENQTSITVGGKPGEFGWSPAAKMAAALQDAETKPAQLEGKEVPPFVGPTQRRPDLGAVGESVRKILSAKAARDVVEEVSGAKVTGVSQIAGSWEGKSEPSFVLSGEMTFEQANDASKLLGFLMAQDATVSTQPWVEETEDQIRAVLISQNKAMSAEQAEALAEAARSAGLDYSTTVDGRGAKFLHFGDDTAWRELGVKAKQIADAAGLQKVTAYFVRSNLNEATTYLEGRNGENLRGARDRDGSTGPSDLFRRAVDSILVPYAKAVGAEGYRFSPERYGRRFGLNDTEVEYIRAALRPKSGKALSTVPIVTGAETLDPPRNNTRSKERGVTKNDLLWALQARTAEVGLIEPGDYSPEARKIISEAIAEEVIYNLGKESGKNAVGWYDAALKNAKETYERVFPELRQDKDREMLFDAILGIASQGNDVHSNAVFAGRMYHLITREGVTLGQATKTLTGTFGKQTVAIEKNYAKLEHLLDTNGYDRMRGFFNTTATVGELNAILRKDETLFGPNGKPLKIEGAAEQTVSGWMVFGPKIGSFINNLHGDYSTLTADLWFSRTWNRMLGYVFNHKAGKENDQYVKLYRAMVEEARTGVGRDLVGTSQAEIDSWAADPESMLTFARETHLRRETEYKTLRDEAVTPLRQAAKNLLENREEATEIPRTDWERYFQQTTVEQAQKVIRRKTGVNISIADIQAVLWYHEKDLYKSFGVGDSKAEAADYADAAARFVDRFKEGDLFFVEKPKPRYVVGEKGSYLAGDTDDQGAGEVVRSSRRGSTLSELTVRNEIKDAIQAWESPVMPGKTDKMSIARQLRTLKSALAADNMSLDDKHLLAYNSLAEASRINLPSGRLNTDNRSSPVLAAITRMSPAAAARDLATRLLAADGRYPVGGLVLDVAIGAKTPQVSIESATGGFFGTVYDPTADSLAASLEEFIPDRVSVKEVRAFLEEGVARSARRAAPDTQAFRDWFGNSKMVDRNGAPVTFMHGSPNAFEAFSDEALGTGSAHASAGLGHFFTTSTSLAEKYADGGNLYRGWLRIEKPYRMPLEEAQSFDTVSEAKARRAALQAQGYDGIVILDDMRKPWATVAFAPWQFKSENNVGTFDEFDDRFARSARRDPAYADITPEQDAALRAVGLIREPKTAKQRFAELTDGLSKRLVQGIVDQYAPLKELDFRSYVLARMSKGSDGTLEAAMYYGTPRVAGDTIEIDTSTGGFLKMMSQLNGEQDRFLSWIAANRAEQLTAEGREFLFTPQQIADLKGLNQGTMKDGTDRTQRYARVLGEFNAFQDAVLAIAEDRGLIDQASRTVWQNGFYVPFYRNMEDGTTGPSVKSGLVNQYAFKKLKGSSRQLNEDLLANTLQNMAHLLGAASKNQAARASLVAAQSAGVAHRVPAGTKGSVRFLDGGREQHFIIDDPFIYDAITSLESVKVVGLEKVLSKFKHWLTLGVTINPAFQLRSLLRDMIASMAVSDIEKNPLTNVSTGIRSQLVKDQDYINALASGGLIRFNSLMEGNRADHTRKLIKMGVADQTILDTPEKVKHFFTKALDKYLAVGDISESTNRMALYKQQIAKGTDPLLAAYMSRDLMDFSMQGQWRAVRFLTQVVPFLNARLQGLYKLGRDGVVPVARVLVGGGDATDKQIAKRFSAVTGAVAMASILLLSAYKDDEDWKKREDWDRDTYWWFKLGDTAYRIPKPFEVGAIGTIAERGFELMTSDEMTGKRFGERMGHMMSSTFALNPIPQAVKPLLDVYSNEDSFTQRPIETMGMERLKPEDRFTGNTSEVAKWLGKLGLPEPGRLMAGQIQPLSPVQIDALIRGYFSWLGVSASRVVDESVRVVADRPERPAMQLRDMFFAGNFVEGLPANASRYVTSLYDQAKGIEEAYASYRFALRQGNRERAMELMDLEGDKIRMQPMVAKGKQALSKLNESIRAIERDPGMSALEKRERIDRIKAMQNTISMRVSAALR